MNQTHVQEMKKSQQAALSARQERLIAELLTQPTLHKAAANAGVPERTAQRWVSGHAAFRPRLHKARRAQIKAAINASIKAQFAPVEALRKIAEDEQAPPAKRLAACVSILKLFMRGPKLNLTERIATVERQTREMTERLRATAARPR